MRLAVLSGMLTPLTRSVVDLFSANSAGISVVIVETSLRRRFTANERAYQKAHAKLRRILASRNGGSVPLRHLFTSLPWPVKGFLRRWGHRLPIVAERTAIRTAAHHRIPVELVRRHSSPETRAILERYRIDLVVLCGSQWLIREPLLSMQGVGILNAHCGKLPLHRSLDSVGWSILSGDETGLTTHFVDAGIDTGPTVLFRPIAGDPGDRYEDLIARIDAAIPEVLLESVRGLAAGVLRPIPQDPAAGTWHRPMTVDEHLRAVELFEQGTGAGRAGGYLRQRK